MARRRVLSLLALAVALCGAASAVPATAVGQLRLQPLLPLARGRLEVSLGDPPQWLPVSGRALTLTLFSGRPRGADAAALNAYVAFQRAGRGCATTAAGAHAHPLYKIGGLYSAANLVSRGHSPFAPGGGAAAGDYAASLPGVVVHQAGTVRACVWLAPQASQPRLTLVQEIPLLNGVFAASVSALPSAGSSGGTAYTFDATDVARSFRYAVSTEQCGTRSSESRAVADGALATESIAYSTSACAGDGSTFTSTKAGGGSLGTLSYTVADAELSPPLIVSSGACELDPITVTPLVDAGQYVQAVGCTVGRLLVAPFERGLPRGAVLEAQVDGGLAEVAPRGTAVDLVLNGR